MCYNTLARANQVMREDEEKRFTINSFMEEEPDYEGDVDVLHLLPFLRDAVGWDTVREKVQVPLTGLKVAPYYGCTLLRPRDVAIEPTDRPTLFKEFIEALGAEPVSFPASVDCCSSYQMVSHPEEALKSAKHVLDSAKDHGAEALVSSCPLCEFNLGRKQEAMATKNEGFAGIPTYYFTQLLAVALGLEEKVCRFELNEPASRELLDSRKFIQSA
jgi:heterodisulfide reductase subunit B